jgi:hypothetical protein
MTEKPYGLVHAKSLLGPCSEEKYWVIDDRGVLPSFMEEKEAKRLGLIEEYKFFSWRPAKIFERDVNAPDVINTPALPFPFDGRDLAAFMLYGVGSMVSGFYGDWETGPNKWSIEQIDESDNFARKAVEQAYVAYREALKIVDPYPLELDAEADRARKAWSVANHEANQREGVFDSKPGTKDSKARRERAKASNAALDLKMEATAAEAQAAKEKWLEAMVRQLMQSAPAKATTTPAPQVVASGCNSLPIFGHSTKTRRDALTPVIEQAQKECNDPTDTAEVWATLQVLAEKKTPPLIGATEEGLQYLKNGGVAIFNRDALRKRLAR